MNSNFKCLKNFLYLFTAVFLCPEFPQEAEKKLVILSDNGIRTAVIEQLEATCQSEAAFHRQTKNVLESYNLTHI